MNVTEYLELLAITPDEFVGMLWKNATEIHTAVMPAPTVAVFAEHEIPRSFDAYLAPNPTAGPARRNAGRGTEEQVTRVAALYADLDIKPGGCPDLDIAYAIIADLSELIHERPVIIIHSGGGLQPIWTLEQCGPTDGRGLLCRFGRLVKAVAQTRNVATDSVFDMARVLRVPGSFNHKYGEPIQVKAVADTGAPIDPAALDYALDEAGIYAFDDDTALSTEIIKDPVTCGWAQITCGYMHTTMSQWRSDQPPARHPWLLSQFIRLECAHRYGCLTEIDYRSGIDTLLTSFAILLQRHDAERKPGRYEIRDIRTEATTRAARKTDEQVADELGRHPHLTHGLPVIPPVPPIQLSNFIPPAATTASTMAITNGDTGVRLVLGSQLRSAAPTWAWEYHGAGRIQLGTMAILAGRPGVGKSTVARWFAAGYTTGRIPGCFFNRPVNVAYIAPAEESHTYVIKPGLDIAGADLGRLCFPEITEEGQTVRLSSAAHEMRLVKSFLENGIRIVIVDPIMSTIPANVNINQNNETRMFIEPWARIASYINGVVLGVAHFTKYPGTDLVAAINGSSAFGEVARAIFGFVREKSGQRIMSQVKNSTGREDLSVTYELGTGSVPTDDGGVAETTVFTITGISELTAADAMETDTNEPVRLGKADVAERWLTTFLEANGRARAKDVVARAKADEDISKATLYRTAKRIGVVQELEGMPARSYWCLSETHVVRQSDFSRARVDDFDDDDTTTTPKVRDVSRPETPI